MDQTPRSCENCKNCGWDPDGAYCAAPKVRKLYPHGLVLWSDKLPTFCPSPRLPLFEEREWTDEN